MLDLALISMGTGALLAACAGAALALEPRDIPDPDRPHLRIGKTRPPRFLTAPTRPDEMATAPRAGYEIADSTHERGGHA